MRNDALEVELGERAYSWLDYPQPFGKVLTKDFLANEVCWALLILMSVGGLDIPMDEREMLGSPLRLWNDLAFQRERAA